MTTRNSRRAVSDNYIEARNAILTHSKKPQALQFIWLEVAEGRAVDQYDYVIHESGERSEIPPFAIEVYEAGRLMDYEVRRDVIRDNALMPEQLRQRIVLSQKASDAIEQMIESSPVKKSNPSLSMA